MNPKRRELLYHQQEGRCYLRIALDCQKRDGMMRLKVCAKDRDLATVEHLIPRSDRTYEMRSPTNATKRVPQLLACKDCNVQKGGRNMATPQHYETEARFWAEWNAKHRGGKTAVSARSGTLGSPQ